MEASKKRKMAPAATPVNEGSASKKLKLLVCPLSSLSPVAGVLPWPEIVARWIVYCVRAVACAVCW